MFTDLETALSYVEHCPIPTVIKADGLALGPSAAVGSLLLLAADVVAQRVHPDSPLPVGIVTVSIGGVYFLWLLLREGKKR